MFDIGFLELVLIAIVSLLVVGPERLPGAIRTGSAYVRRIRRSLTDIRQEIEQELHNDAVMQELKETQRHLSETGEAVKESVTATETEVRQSLDSTASAPNSKPGKSDSE